MNGAAARLVRNGDKVIVASFGAFDEKDLERYSPVVVHVNDDNEVTAVDSDPTVLLGEDNPEQESTAVSTQPPSKPAMPTADR